jgi:hypothetical protein
MVVAPGHGTALHSIPKVLEISEKYGVTFHI